MDETLKPCPFCPSGYPELEEEGNTWYVRCDRCGAEGPKKGCPEEAISTWNRRESELVERFAELAQRLLKDGCSCYLVPEGECCKIHAFEDELRAALDAARREELLCPKL